MGNTRRMMIAFERMVLFFLYRGMKVLRKYDSGIGREVMGWPKGRTIEIAASPAGPRLCMKRTAAGIVRADAIQNPDILISFKNLEAALLVFSGKIGTSQAYAQHRFMVKGEIAEVMSIVRCLDLVEAYLFPPFITRKILRKQPQKQIGSIAAYCHVILGI